MNRKVHHSKVGKIQIYYYLMNSKGWVKHTESQSWYHLENSVRKKMMVSQVATTTFPNFHKFSTPLKGCTRICKILVPHSYLSPQQYKYKGKSGIAFPSGVLIRISTKKFKQFAGFYVRFNYYSQQYRTMLHCFYFEVFVSQPFFWLKHLMNDLPIELNFF